MGKSVDFCRYVPAFALALVFSLVFSGCGDAGEAGYSGLGIVEQHGDLVISEGSHVIEGKSIAFFGSLIINGTAKVTIKDSVLDFRQEYDTQHRIVITDEAEASFENVEILTNEKWMYAEIFENPQVSIRKLRSWDPNVPWWNTGWNSTVLIKDTTIGISILGNSKLEAENSNIFFEPLFSNSTGTFMLPEGHLETYSLSVGTDFGAFKIDARNCTIRSWGTTLMYNSDITFVDSKITIGINAGSAWPEYTSPNIRVSGLKAGMYDDFELPFDTNKLKLINTEVTSWYPQAFGGAVMEIDDSELADLQWSGDDATVIVRDSSIEMAFARHSVRYEIYGSRVKGDVTATGESEIHLYGTAVEGVLREDGGGKVFVDGERIVGG